MTVDVFAAAEKRTVEPSPLAAAHERVEHIQPKSPPRTSTSVDNSMNVGLEALLLDDKPERYSPSAPVQELPPLQAVMDEVGSDLDEDAMMALIEEHSLITSRVEIDMPSPSPEITADDSSLFFIDTTAAPPSETPLYDTSVTSIVGQADASPSGSEDEKIVFVPKTYRAPEPISVPSSSRPSVPAVNRVSESIMTLPSDPPSGKKANRKEKKAAKKAKKKTRGVQKEPRQGDSDLEWGDDGPPSLPGRRTWGGNDDMAILQDYIDGTAGHGVDDDDEDAESLDEDAMRAFVGGIKDMGARNQSTINDVEDGEKMRMEDEWQSASGSGSEDEDEDEELHLGIGINVPEDQWIEQDSESDSDDEIDIDDDDDSDDDDDDDGPEMFVGKSTWADESEDFIAGMEVSYSCCVSI